jgi:dUTP diphosphatase
MSADHKPKLRVKKLSETAILPSRQSKGAIGYDLYSDQGYIIPAHGKALIQTNIAVKIPDGMYGRIAPRSSLAHKHFIDIGAGVIDPDYRGPIGVIMFNLSDEDFHVVYGDRIAQLILEYAGTPGVLEVDELDETDRGEGGFGSTGK